MSTIFIVVLVTSFALVCVGCFVGYISRVTHIDVRSPFMLVAIIFPTVLDTILLVNTASHIGFRQTLAIYALPILCAIAGIALGRVDWS